MQNSEHGEDRTRKALPPQPEPFSVDEHYSEAPGSGAAAVLAFLHIMISGILGYGSYYLLRHGTEATLASPHLSWQFFLPLALALFLNLPSNPLSRVLGTTAFAFGVLGALATVITTALVLLTPSRQFEQIPTSLMFTRMLTGILLTAALSWGVRWLFLRLLPRRDVTTE